MNRGIKSKGEQRSSDIIVDISEEDFKRIHGSINTLFNLKVGELIRARLFFRNIFLGQKIDVKEYKRHLKHLQDIRDFGNEIKIYTEKIINEWEKIKNGNN